ncbi:uncharacterized protein LOC116305045 [Actinia tenebrosa]|uniref:Uncharacterized protein LOC116305045 n=1 Tax=Actinia tenebrosa TaxID=6105 RepID=A0A6P8IU11_ACTTE|nr:uncharacterized protein LOC116305045 [Actinia tenebrosa]XP_031570728.1 uncharacterized protein LOC116305045 [Actinia tenebrosa]XP_031570729.1 uncharacterized protein LOC116305045 [Actinia tenebrosa]XP_031570730.1 uncharacterized protein LOC116305045 [Actinia tenebrosa]XP_031570731.1 uncharacterized protein LOC116305045 [Actinia tenebrosa]XP_031570733.1 uncharacterized protein LOC116305045 [Actinia tenebrosa]
MRRAKELNITPLISTGLPKYALIGCAFDFLFEKSRAVEHLLQLWKDKVREAGGPTIGVHIRTGDLQFDYFSREDERINNLKNLTRLNGFFKCARHVEQTVFKFNESTNNALWFLATDNNRVKEYARKNFPGKVVTTNLTIQHLDILHNTTILNDTIECNFTTGFNGSAFCYNVVPFNKTLFCANRTNHTKINDNSTIFNDTHQYAKEKRKINDAQRNMTSQIALHQQNTFAKRHKRNPFETHTWDKSNRLRLCGSGWQDKYARLHSDMVASRKNEKYLAYTCPPGNRQGCCGYGNRLRAVVSLFYLSILTGRAFLINWQTPEPIENHLKPKRILWNHSPPSNVETRRHYWGTAGANSLEARGWIIRDSKHFNNWFTETNLSSYFDAPIEEVTTIWYFVESGIKNNPYLMRRAKELNITPLISTGLPKYALIGCAFDFLFEKSRAVKNLLQLWKDKVREAGGPTIGVHIRTGDLQFENLPPKDDRFNNLKNLTRLNGFFKCARHVEQTVFKFNESTNNALWFLATDNNRVKEYARKNFPGKVVTTNLTIQHLDILQKNVKCRAHVNGSKLCNKSVNTSNTHQHTNGIIAMLVEHFILSECDFLIICDSSFSSTAVGLSMRGGESFVFGDRDCLDYTRAQNLRKTIFF